MSGIRVGYSGLISFLVGIISILTTMIFTVIITRTLVPTEYGAWGLINGLIVYSMILDPIVSYWALRETSRGLSSAKTAIISSGLFSAVGIFIYLIIVYFLSPNIDDNPTGLFLGFILIPVMFLNAVLVSISLGWKPQLVSYSVLVLGISKIITGVVFVYFLEMGIMGLIIAVTISFMASITFLAISSREKINHEFNWKFFKKWIKLSWLPMYPGISSIILRLDMVIFTVLTGSVLGLAFWSAAIAVTVVVSQVGNISIAIYPKLMQEKNRDYLKNNITQLFYFAIPITLLTIIFAKPALYLLNPEYQIASVVAVLLAIQLFLYTLNKIFENLLLGTDEVDVNKNSTFHDYFKSKLFFAPTVRLIQTIIYVGLLFAGLLIITSKPYSEMDLLIFWAFTWVIAEIFLTLYFYKYVKKNIDLKLESKIISKYLILGIVVFGTMYIITDKFLTYDPNFFEFLPKLLLFIVPGILLYFTVTYLFDQRTRSLCKIVLNEIQLVLKGR